MSRLILPFKINPLAPAGRSAGFDPTHFASKGCFWSVVSTGASAVNLCKPSPRPTAQVSAPTRVIDGNLGLASKFTGVSSNGLSFTGGAGARVDLAFTYACFYRPATIASNTSIVSNSTTVNSGSLLSYNTGNACLILGSELVAPMLSGINLVVGVPYFIIASATGPSASTSTWTHNWFVQRLDTGKILTATGTSSQSWAASNGNMIFGGANSSQGNLDADGNLAAAMYSNVFTSIPQMQQWAQDPWAFWYPRTLDLVDMLSTGSGGGTAYTLPGAEGAFVINGQSSTETRALRVGGVEGAFVISGQSATLSHNYKLANTAGSFLINGQSAAEFRSLHLPNAAGVFTINGEPTTTSIARHIAGTEGSFVINGESTTIKHGYTLPNTEGTFLISGKSSTEIQSLHLGGVEGAFTINGQAAALTYTPNGSHTLAANAGAFIINGEPATFTYTPIGGSILRQRTLTGVGI